MKKAWNYFRERYIEIHGMLFTIFSLITFFIGNADRFWMFFITGITLNALQTIVDELKNNKLKNKDE